MHIVIIPSWYPRDAADFNGSFFVEQAQGLRAEGHEVGVLAVSGEPVYLPGRWVGKSQGTRSSIENGLPVLRHRIVVPLPWLHAINQRVWNGAWKAMLGQYIREHGRPDVLHAHSMFPGGLAAHALSRDFGIPFVVTEHRPSSIHRLEERGMRRLAIAAAHDAGGLVAVARGFVPQLDEAYGLTGEGWTYVPGMLSPQFETADPRPVPDAPFTIGHVSHLDPGKRVQLLIRAFADAFPGGDERLRIVGDSTHRYELEQYAESRGIANRVDFVGAVPRRHIAAEFARFHAFALPSVAEAFGTVLWEAMASGVPLVSTRTWAGENAVTDTNGVLVPIDDGPALAAALRAIKDRIGEYDPQQVRSLAMAHCGRSTFVAEYLEVYRKALSR